MKSKWLFIFIGGFIAVAAVMYYRGVIPEIIMLLTGITVIITGIVTLIMEMRWRENSDVTPGKVTGYYEYLESGSSTTRSLMYTMEAEYTTLNGKKINSREQSGSTVKKYPAGTEIRVRYSREDPDLFIIDGDNSRIYAMLGTIVFGIAVGALSWYMIKNGITMK